MRSRCTHQVLSTATLISLLSCLGAASHLRSDTSRLAHPTPECLSASPQDGITGFFRLHQVFSPHQSFPISGEECGRKGMIKTNTWRLLCRVQRRGSGMFWCVCWCWSSVTSWREWMIRCLDLSLDLWGSRHRVYITTFTIKAFYLCLLFSTLFSCGIFLCVRFMFLWMFTKCALMLLGSVILHCLHGTPIFIYVLRRIDNICFSD